MKTINLMSMLRFSKGKLFPSVNFFSPTMFLEHCEAQECFSVVSLCGCSVGLWSTENCNSQSARHFSEAFIWKEFLLECKKYFCLCSQQCLCSTSCRTDKNLKIFFLLKSIMDYYLSSIWNKIYIHSFRVKKEIKENQDQKAFMEER